MLLVLTVFVPFLLLAAEYLLVQGVDEVRYAVAAVDELKFLLLSASDVN